MSRRPAFQFYPGDWRNDAGLRLCTLPARGLWLEMMCLMHEGTPYGHLTVLGRPIGPDALARLCGESPTAVKRWLKELGENEVFSLTDEGVIYSRRMVRDEAVREARAAGGPAGALHGAKGASHGAKGGRPRKEKPPFDDEVRGVSEPPPSSSSSSPSPEEEDPVADATDGKPSQAPALPTAIDLKSAIFGSGIPLLMATDMDRQKAATMLGKWRKNFGDGAVLDALAACQAEAASDPIPFITRTLETRNGNRSASRPADPRFNAAGREDPIFAARRALGIDG